MLINTIRTIILTIAIITTIMAVIHKEKNIIFVAKKVIILISIQIMNNKKQKNFRDKIEHFIKIKANTIHFWLIIKEI